MGARKYISILLVVGICLSFAACNGDKDGKSNNPTVKTGSVEDIFGLTQANSDEVPTINSDLIDGDSGKIDITKETKKTETTKRDANKETTVASKITANSTNEGYKLTWGAVSGAKIYNVYRADTKDGEYVFLGSTANTYYIDKNGSSSYFYKVTVAPQPEKVDNSSKFIGNSISYENQGGKQTYVSSQLNNAYIAYVRNLYSKMNYNCPPGRLAYVKIQGDAYTYIFQFDSTKTWNGSTLEQVQIFTDANDQSKYFSFFIKETGSADYIAARNVAIKEWNKMQKGKDGADYEKTQQFLVLIADDPVFQQVIDASY